MVIKKPGPSSFPKLPAVTPEETAPVQKAPAATEVESKETSSAYSQDSMQKAFSQSAIIGDGHPALEEARPSSVKRMSAVLTRSIEQVGQDLASLKGEIESVKAGLFENAFEPGAIADAQGELSRLRRKARQLSGRKHQLTRRRRFLESDVPRTKTDSTLPADASPMVQALSLIDSSGDAVAVRFKVGDGASARLGTQLAHKAPSKVITEQAIRDLGVDVHAPRPDVGEVSDAEGVLAQLLNLP